jgi:tRNA nucleotidyltransferase (CCA-adding enzyme)
LDESLPLIKRLSPERLRHEIDQILSEPKAVPMLARLDQLGLLKMISPELRWNSELSARLEAALSASLETAWGQSYDRLANPVRVALLYSLWLLDEPVSVIESLHTRLCFPMATFKAIRAAAELTADLPALRGQKPSTWVARLDGLPTLAVYGVYLVSREADLETYARHWQHVHPFTTGDTLKARGLAPGPTFQKILSTLRSAWLDGEVDSAADEERLLDKYLK